MQKTVYLVTGAAGHLGTALCEALHARGENVRALVLPGDAGAARLHADVFYGNVCDRASLAGFFDVPEGVRSILVHCAAVIDIGGAPSDMVYAVNVEGTRNVMQLCLEKAVSRVVYVNSVHALPPRPFGVVRREVDAYSPDMVEGKYAKSKAMAASLVQEFVQRGLPAVIVQPSGIIGPYDGGNNHLVAMVIRYLKGKLPAGVVGGYDFVDVRDVADGILAAAEKGRVGESYLLTGGFYSVREMLGLLASLTGKRRVPCVPVWLARLAAPFSELHARRKKQRPLFTAYSLRVLRENARFSHDKATAELGYRPRGLDETLADTVSYLRRNGILGEGGKRRGGRISLGAARPAPVR